MAWLSNFLRSPFSFLFTGTRTEEQASAYVIREHERGRPLHDILEDPYLRNRYTPEEIARLLDRPEIVHVLGEGAVADARRGI